MSMFSLVVGEFGESSGTIELVPLEAIIVGVEIVCQLFYKLGITILMILSDDRSDGFVVFLAHRFIFRQYLATIGGTK